MKKLCVIGSFNIDLIAKTNALPVKGETVRCSDFDLFIGGGKGANQAVAAGCLGADVEMVGRLGDLFYGEKYIDVLKRNGVGHGCVDVLKNQYPGRAFVVSDNQGDNLLFIHEGTNALVSPAYIDQNWDAISACDIFLLQYEIPMETNLYLLEKLHALGKTIVLDPAPALPMPLEYLAYVDYITPNEIEIQQITGMKIENEADLNVAGNRLLELGVKTVIAKSGKKGAYLITQDEFTHYDAFKSIRAVDTTAAGDTFNAGFAFSLANEKSVGDCIRFANAAAGISTTKIGAQDAMPTSAQVDEFLRQNT